jgi:Uma2 family endonuclease
VAVMLHESPLADAADRLWEELPGHRVEILNGSIVVTPPPDGPHQETCFEVGYAFKQAGAWEVGLRAIAGIGLWLPTGPDDYAVPDLSVVDADYKDARVEKNCYAPHVFRLVVEVTSTNWLNASNRRTPDTVASGARSPARTRSTAVRVSSVSVESR